MSTYAITKELIEKYNVEIVDHWDAPETNDARIIGMPNIPKPVQGKGCQPRTILGPKTWNHMRKRCYAIADDTCEICGVTPEDKRYRHSHEIFSIDYRNGVSRFEGCVCLCYTCVDEDTDVLTKDGWKKIPEVTTDDLVACWDRSGSVTFQKPTATIKSYKEEAVKIMGNNATLYFSDEHRLPLKIASKQSPSYGQVKDILAKDYKASHYYNWILGGNGKSKEHLTAKERIYIALEADGHLVWDKENVGTRTSTDGKRQRAWGNRYGSADHRYTYTIHLSKTRKIERLKMLLKESGLDYQIKKETSNSYCDFNIWTDVECKHFANCFDIEMGEEKALEFIEELVFWDGTFSGRTTTWFTNKPEEIDFVQAIGAQCNVKTTVTVVNRIGNLRKGQWRTPYERLTYSVNFCSVNNEICAREMKPERVKWNKEMYCLTVPTSYFIARRDRLVFVTGNCHILSIHNGRALTLYKNNSPLMSKESLLLGAENAFRIAKEWNDTHEEKFKLYGNFLNYLKVPTLEKEMLELIDKYKPEFYISTEGSKDCADWGKWKVIVGNNEYPSPYQSEKDWENAMENASKNDTDRRVKTPLQGEVFDKLDELLQKPVENFNKKHIDKNVSM